VGGQLPVQFVSAPDAGHVLLPEPLHGAQIVAAVAHIDHPPVKSAADKLLQHGALAEIRGAQLTVGLLLVGQHQNLAARLDAGGIGEHAGEEALDGVLPQPLADEEGVGIADDAQIDRRVPGQPPHNSQHPRHSLEAAHTHSHRRGVHLVLAVQQLQHATDEAQPAALGDLVLQLLALADGQQLAHCQIGVLLHDGLIEIDCGQDAGPGRTGLA